MAGFTIGAERVDAIFWGHCNLTSVSVVDAYGISSIADGGAGSLTITIPDFGHANYTFIAAAAISGSYTAVKTHVANATTCAVYTSNPSSWVDAYQIYFAAFGNPS